jgi:activating signal cointegrator 1
MKVLTLTQPWATLIAIGEKKFETRSRRTHHRGPLAIHAGKQIDLDAMTVPEIKNALIRHGITDWTKLPYGAIIATCNVVDCLQVTWSGKGSAALEGKKFVKDDEFVFGWYERGRFAYEMADIKQIDPIPAKGQQGLWNYPI